MLLLNKGRSLSGPCTCLSFSETVAARVVFLSYFLLPSLLPLHHSSIVSCLAAYCSHTVIIMNIL